jgi:hypothetical protein
VLDEAFALVYGSEGAFTWTDLTMMTVSDRRQMLNRLYDQKAKERDKIKAATTRRR